MTGDMGPQIRNILIERRAAVSAVQSHRAWLKDLEKCFPPGPRGGVKPFVKDARNLQESFRRLGVAVFLDQLVDRFAYHAERWKQITDPEARRSHPYLRYVSALLPTSRPSHMEKHGHIFAIDHPFWSHWAPLNGFNCFCTTMSVSEYDLKRYGWTVDVAEYWAHALPDEGFDFNIGQILSVEGL